MSKYTNDCTRIRFLRDPSYYLNKALYFYYGQEPNVIPTFKPGNKINDSNNRCYRDCCSSLYYDVHNKIINGENKSKIDIEKTDHWKKKYGKIKIQKKKNSGEERFGRRKIQEKERFRNLFE